MSYRVELPVFSGPMDLLLHLVKQQELDVHEIRIADILDQYLRHLAVLQELDLGDLGDFIVMASTLMEIKSREILPSEKVEISAELDPRDDLIRRLLEYKRYRDISRRLDRLANERSRMLPAAVAPPTEAEPEDNPLLDLGDVEIWNLTAMFAKLLDETGQRATSMTLAVDRRGVHHYAAQVLERVRERRDVRFEELFERVEGRVGLIGVFIAVLELMKQGVLRAHQEANRGAITVAFVGDPSLTVDQILAGGERLDEDEYRVGPPAPAQGEAPAGGDQEPAAIEILN